MYNRLYITRAWRGFTQQKLAECAGVSRSTICFLERTGGYPSMRIGIQLCRALECSFEEVFPVEILL